MRLNVKIILALRSFNIQVRKQNCQNHPRLVLVEVYPWNIYPTKPIAILFLPTQLGSLGLNIAIIECLGLNPVTV